MKLLEKENCYIIEDFFPSSIIAGFTKISLDGRQVEENIRAAMRDIYDSEVGVAFMRQQHLRKVFNINSPGIYEGDALFTKNKNIVLVVKTADCLPVFFYDGKNDTAGVIHLGWCSAKEGILDNINVDFPHSRALAGAALRKCCFKVTDEFLEYDKLAPFVIKKGGRFYYDPIAFSRDTLINKGLKISNFEDLDMCTFCDSRKFFSYRRDKTKNRMLSFIFKK